MKLARVLNISRYRFWIYELGPFVYGVFSATPTLAHLLTWQVFVFALFFLFPANLYIYGINDMFDYETDKLNPRKVEYEALVEPREWKSLSIWIACSVLPFLLLVPISNKGALYSMIAFLFFAGFYSAKPIRAKSKPILDSIFSAGHYVATGAFGYYLLGGSSFPIIQLSAALSWSIAMHAYSAVPDIESDSRAGLKTIATTLGKTGTILLCLALYVKSALLVFPYIGIVAIILCVLYTGLMLGSLFIRKPETLLKLMARR